MKTLKQLRKENRKLKDELELARLQRENAVLKQHPENERTHPVYPPTDIAPSIVTPSWWWCGTTGEPNPLRPTTYCAA